MDAAPGSETTDSHPPVDELEASGRRLVETLAAQLADGQVETLYTLQTAAAQVRRHAAAVTGATESLTDSLTTLTERVADEVRQGFAVLLQQAHAAIGEQLAAEVDASSTELRGAAQDHARLVASQLEVTSTQLSSLYDGVVARTEDARQGLEWVAAQGAEQLTAAAATLAGHRTEGEAALAQAGEALAERVQAVASTVGADLQASAEAAMQHLRDGVQALIAHAATARDEIEEVMLEARKAAEAELIALRKQIQAAERREETVAERLEQYAEALVARTDATVSQSLTHLRGVADALLERDAHLEKRRADEFARVLETVLREGGAGTRKLRDRIFRGMDAAKQQPIVAVPAPEPARDAPAEPVTPPKKAATKKAAPKTPTKAPTKPPTKTPSKKAPAEQATARADVAPATTGPVQEEQA
jgi:heparin binding hemagglutinin HbhA